MLPYFPFFARYSFIASFTISFRETSFSMERYFMRVWMLLSMTKMQCTAGSFSATGAAGRYGCGVFPVGDSSPSSPVFMLSFNKSLLPISVYFNFSTSCAKAM